jgi:hypothetical protein
VSEEILPNATRLPIKRSARWFIVPALMLGIGGNVVAALAATTLWSMPAGSPVRPLGAVGVAGLAAMACFIVGVPVAAIGLFRSRGSPRTFLLSILALVLLLSPLATWKLTFTFVAWAHNLTPEP